MTDPPSTARTSQAQRPGGAAPQSDNHVFVSYAREDKAFVTALRDFLASESREVWVDWEGIPASAEWFAEIERAIAAADAVVFVLSPDFADSETCAKEAELAVQYNKKIIPVVHRDVTPDRQPEQVRARQWIFARDEEESKAGFASLRHALDTDLEWVREHARLLNRALAWDARPCSWE